MLHALIAPDSFKGTMGAKEVADAIAAGFEDQGWSADRCPLADGGEGTAEALLKGLGGEWIGSRATDPVGGVIDARFALLADGTAVVETAEASGLWRLSKREALRADTTGTGKLIVAAAQQASRVLLGVGGSASTDGGAGAIEAIVAGGGLGGSSLICLCDVDIAWERAASVFAPQKGASGREVFLLEDRLAELAPRLPRDPRGVPRTGAAGGLAGGLWAAFGATLVSGAAHVCDELRLDERIEQADLVVSGEGRLDSTTLAGKVLAEVAKRCRQKSKPLHAVVGSDGSDNEIRRELALSSVREAGDAAALARAGVAIASA